MAELQFDDMTDEGGLTLPSLRQVVNAGGALVSLGLIAGLAWWGYQLVVRDVSGVPVVRALEGPMRVAPDDPGGEFAAHTGLAVNNIPAAGIAAEPADRLVLAPDRGQLAEEDLPKARLAEIAPRAEAETPPPAQPQVQAAPAAPAEATPAEDVSEEIDDLIGAALAEATGTIAGPNGQRLTLVPPDVGGVTKSPLPVPRPANLQVVERPPLADDGFVTIAADQIPAGTRLVQLGAFDSEEVAKSEWARLAALYPQFMTDKARVIERAQSGGKTFYRLRAHGFEGLADARRFCSALLADDINCIPVRQR